MKRGLANAGLVIIVLVMLGLAGMALTTTQGEAPLPPVAPEGVLEIDSLDDLATLSEADLRRLLEAGGEVRVRELGADVDERLEELSEGIRALDQTFHVPPARSRGGTASTGASGRPPRRAGDTKPRPQSP